LKSSTDHLGSSSVITDGNGSSVQALYYYPYGEIQSNIGIDVARYKFTGQEWDAETALYYYGARYYDPKLARFISADTIVPEPFYPQSLNRYAYCINNPIILRDLDGHEWDSFSSWVSSGWNSFTNWASNAWDSFTSSFGSGGGSRSYSYNTNFNVDYSDWQSKNNSPSVLSYNSYSSSSTSSVGIGGGSGASLTSVTGGGGGYGGGTMYAANTGGNGTATDAGSGGSGNSKGSSLIFNGQNVYWFNDQGQPIGDYSAVSGPYGEGRLPEGIYTGDNLRVRNDNTAMMCPNGGWSLDLTPDFQTDRTLLRIHPDGNKPGTLGCIGVNCTASGQLYNDLRSYFKSGNSSIPVIVNYNLRVNLGENK
jgi:RHS repeat-associated protein